MLAHSSFHAGKFVIAMLFAAYGLQSPLPQNETKRDSDEALARHFDFDWHGRWHRNRGSL